MFLKTGTIILILLINLSGLSLFANDKRTAEALGQKCKKEAAILAIPVENFGAEKDKKDFEAATKAVKMGQVLLAQTKFLDAKAKFEEYQALQYTIYESLAKKYLERTKVIQDEVGLDLADHIENQEVVKYLKLAAQNAFDAKTSFSRKQYNHVVNQCRTAKSYALGAYKLVGMKTPAKYQRDLDDNEKKISASGK